VKNGITGIAFHKAKRQQQTRSSRPIDSHQTTGFKRNALDLGPGKIDSTQITGLKATIQKTDALKEGLGEIHVHKRTIFKLRVA
jgi:hypothetical protein